jgi:cell division ATPase FtsA
LTEFWQIGNSSVSLQQLQCTTTGKSKSESVIKARFIKTGEWLLTKAITKQTRYPLDRAELIEQNYTKHHRKQIVQQIVKQNKTLRKEQQTNKQHRF